MMLGGGTSCVLFSFKQKGLVGFAERFLPLASGASEQHLAMSRVLLQGSSCHAGFTVLASLCCPARQGHLVAGFQGGRSPASGRLPSRVSALSRVLFFFFFLVLGGKHSK